MQHHRERKKEKKKQNERNVLAPCNSRKYDSGILKHDTITTTTDNNIQINSFVDLLKETYTNRLASLTHQHSNTELRPKKKYYYFFFCS